MINNIKTYNYRMRFFYNKHTAKMCLEITSEDNKTNNFFNDEVINVFGRITGLYSIPINNATDEYFDVKITVEDVEDNPVLMVVKWKIGLLDKIIRSIPEEDLKKDPWPSTLKEYFQFEEHKGLMVNSEYIMEFYNKINVDKLRRGINYDKF